MYCIFTVGIFLVKILAVICQTPTFNATLCVLKEKVSDCMQLSSLDAPFQCVGARDRIECLHKVENGEADITTVPSNEAFAAYVNNMKTLIPLLEEQTNDGDFMYEAVAVVRSDSNIKFLKDLKGKKSCHTGYKRTAGWDIPIAFLTSQQVLPCSNNNELADVSSFFSSSCVPGSWSKNTEQNNMLKKEYKTLCQLCDQYCNTTSTEKYAGYEGALKCLMEKSADVAFSKFSVVTDFAKSNKEFADNYRLLCANGSLNFVNNSCYWGARPNPLVVARNNTSSENLAKLKTKLIQLTSDTTRPPFFSGTILMNGTSKGLRNINGSIEDHLLKANFSTTMIKLLYGNCREKYARLCVNSDLEKAKCQDLKISTYAARLRPTLHCVSMTPDCVKASADESGFTVAGLKTSYDALKGDKLVSAMEETFPDNKPNYYLVAVVKSNSNITKLSDLKGKKSCHSNFQCGASWNIPKGVLLSKKLINGKPCDLDKQMSEFFSSSCVPGAPKNLPKLCSLCKDKSKCSDSDEYEGFTGALRCLVEGGGDVAFIQHSLIRHMTDNPNVDQAWAKGLKSIDYKLLCATDGVKTIQEFEACNWAKIPGRQLLFPKSISDPLRQSILLMLTRADSTFGLESSTFQLYSSYQNKTDVIFSNGTSGLVLQNKTTVTSILGADVVKLMDSTTCVNGAYKIKNDYLVLIVVALFSALRFTIL